MTHERDKDQPPPELNEIAAAGAGIDLSGFIDEIARTSDPLLKSLGGDIKTYQALRLDDQVQSTFQQRRRAVTATDWGVEPGGDAAIDQEAADFLKDQLDNIKWNAKTDKMLWGVFYGYAIAECLWAVDGNRVVLHDIKVRDRARFRFGIDGVLRLLTKDEPKGVIMPDRKFWTFSTGADNDDEPYGLGLAYWLYWPVFLKRNGVKFWAIVLEKFGQPTSLGKYPPNTTPENQKKLLEAVVAVAVDTGVIIPEGMAIEFLEAQRRAGGDHAVFSRYMDAGIAKVVLSQTMTTDDGSSLSQAAVHMDVRQDVVDSDGDLICESFNDGPVKWMTDWNFPAAEYPRVWRLTKEPEDLDKLAERDERLARIGYHPSQKRIDEVFGPGYQFKGRPEEPPGEPPPGVPSSGAAFAEPGGTGADALSRAVEEELAGWEGIMGPLLDPIRDLAGKVGTFEEFREKLPATLAGMDETAAGDALARLSFASNLAGQFDIDVTGEGGGELDTPLTRSDPESPGDGDD